MDNKGSVQDKLQASGLGVTTLSRALLIPDHRIVVIKYLIDGG
jgi:hypothetical protein